MFRTILHLRQEKNAPSRTFLHRTDFLAARMNLRVQDLPDILGVSRRTLFAARADDSAVTNKTWIKLADAEKAIGISEENPDSTMVQEPPAAYNTPPASEAICPVMKESQTHQLLTDIQQRLESLEFMVRVLYDGWKDKI